MVVVASVVMIEVGNLDHFWSTWTTFDLKWSNFGSNFRSLILNFGGQISKKFEVDHFRFILTFLLLTNIPSQPSSSIKDICASGVNVIVHILIRHLYFLFFVGVGVL